MTPVVGGWRAVACVLLLAAMPHHAAAELRALLVGVSGYPSLAPTQHLQGPPTAVQRLRDVLLRRGAAAARITLLADGVPGAALPTRAALLGALDDLARDTRAGDVVLVHFAGHGSRQPDPSRPGSWLPTLLPLDIGRWDGGDQPVTNAVTRDELRTAVDRIAARGAFVWAVFDACHSAGLVRGAAAPAAPEAAAAKALLASWLAGLEAEALPSAAGRPAEARRGGQVAPIEADTRAPLPGAAPPGRTALFYAAQGSEYAGEVAPDAVPGSGGAPTARRHGLFSHVLTQLLDEAQGPISYRQLADALLARYRLLPQARLTPVFAGNGLDVHVLGQDSMPLRQWPLHARPPAATPTPPWWVAAGQLHGISVGARFAVVPDALSRDDQVITQLEAVQVLDDHSLLAPLPRTSGADAAASPASAPALQAEVNQLRLLANGLAYALHVAFDASGCAPPCPLRDAVRQLRATGVAGVDLRWVDAADRAGLAESAAGPPDLRLRADQGRVLMLEGAGPAGPGSRGAAADQAAPLVLDLPASAAPAALARRLAQRLHALARLRNLSQLAARSALDPLQSVLESSVRRQGATTPQAVGALALRHGDQVVLTLRNRGRDPIDVTVLYLDADGGITKLHPTRQGEVNRLEAGDSRELTVDIVPPAVGAERLWAMAAVKRPLEPTIDFGFLEQAALARRRSGNADEIGEHLAGFADAAFAEHLTRGELRPRPPSSRTLIRSHELDVSR